MRQLMDERNESELHANRKDTLVLFKIKESLRPNWRVPLEECIASYRILMRGDFESRIKSPYDFLFLLARFPESIASAMPPESVRWRGNGQRFGKAHDFCSLEKHALPGANRMDRQISLLNVIHQRTGLSEPQYVGCFFSRNETLRQISKALPIVSLRVSWEFNP